MGKLEKGKIKFDTEAAFGYLKGEAKWAELLTVGMYGTYGIKLYGDDVIELGTELEAMQKEAAKEVDELGKKYELADIYKEDEEGKKFLAFKLPENDFEGKANSITMYDVAGNKVPDWSELVGNGSTVKVKYRVAPYYMSSTKKVGLSFKFYAVQVLKLVEYSGGGESGFGDETGSGPIEAADGADF